MREHPREIAVPPRIDTSRAWPLPLILALTALIVAGAAVLYLFDPARHAFYPVCLFKRVTGYDCPGCGGLRAMHDLLRGDVRGAFRLNAMVVVALPLFGVWFLWTRIRPRPIEPVGKRTVLLRTGLVIALVVLFGIVRNLPFWPFGVTPM